jgi:hypothetical protein
MGMGAAAPPPQRRKRQWCAARQSDICRHRGGDVHGTAQLRTSAPLQPVHVLHGVTVHTVTWLCVSSVPHTDTAGGEGGGGGV